MEDWKKTKCGTCIFQRGKPICNSCMKYHLYKPMSNADKIRSMTDEELAEMFTKLAWNSEVQTTPLKYLDWLKAERER